MLAAHELVELGEQARDQRFSRLMVRHQALQPWETEHLCPFVRAYLRRHPDQADLVAGDPAVPSDHGHPS